jgi:nitrate/TMAO reductase-like tetraheme cytochrome c subunit
VNNRLGCLSTTAIISVVITALIIVSVAIASGSSMFSPGRLNAMPGEQTGGVISHAQIGEECSRCHTAFWEKDRMADRCFVCHQEIKGQISSPLTLHGVMVDANQSLECRQCHPEHRGAIASLTEFSADFPHDQLGFSLASHPDAICADCHEGNYTSFNATTCIDCHKVESNIFNSAHVISYGDDCLACHDGIESINTSYVHDLTQFQLTGLHQELECIKCHLGARTITDLQNSPTQCINCHSKDEPHDGRFGTDCEACHDTSGWKPARFDHDLANFKLTGKHIDAKCEDCHADRSYKGTPSSCVSCHNEDDAHQRQLGDDCSLCHSTDAWEPATFDHQTSIFKLTGAHLTVECAQCHENGTFKGTPTTCYACHATDDKHNGRFGTSCDACHTTIAWKPATFDHNLSAFRLTNGHANLACQRCHSKGFSNTPSFCAGCHADPGFHRGMFVNNCAECHNTSNWSASYNGSHPSIDEDSGINHEGASCRDCHTENLATATCTKCHDSNNPGDGGGGGGDD